jgi:glutaminyl-peptide cyclotransferase
MGQARGHSAASPRGAASAASRGHHAGARRGGRVGSASAFDWRQVRVPIIVLAAVIAMSALWYTGHALAQRPPPFDGGAAFQRLKEQCDFGPRVPGTEGHRKCLAYLVGALKMLTPQVEEQSFTFRDGSRDVPMTNLIARFLPPSPGARGADGSGVIVAAHWDTRPTADQEPDPARRRRPIPGANDGASGVAVLLQLARMLKERPPAVPVWLVFFDGEDYGPGEDRMYLGAKQFAAHLPPGVPKVGILLDMIGDRDLEIFKEMNSAQRAGPVVDRVWEIARNLGYEVHFNPARKYSISDDHFPLLDKGIAMIDVIDFDYPYWHTLGDTVDKCSPASLRVVGDVVAAWIYERRL